MNILQALILGIVQGLTEFIPVSSSGHLLLAHRLLGTTENGLGFDVALHIGTLLALLIFFNKDLWKLLVSIFRKSEETRLAWLLIMATIPAVIIGVLLEKTAETSFRSPLLVSINLIIVAVIMLVAERYYAKHKNHRPLKEIDKKQAGLMGLAQAAAIIPGVSRSGSTITMGLFAGLERVAATRFSFLLAVPITAGAILKVLASSEGITQIKSEQGVFLVGIVTAFVSGLFAIRFMLKFLAGHGLQVFAYYRLIVGSIFVFLLALKIL